MNGARGHRLWIQRRFPTFDFVLRTTLLPKEAASKLELFLSQQERPAGFVLTDSRVDGEVFGATFRLRRREAGFGGSVRPYVEGYFVPAEEGSHVYVRIQISRWWWLFSAIVFVTLLTVQISRPDTETFVPLALVGIAIPLVSAIPIWFEGSQMIKLMRRVFRE